MPVDWKGSLPLTALLLVIAVLAWSNISVGKSFVGLVVMAAIVLLVLPVINAVGIKSPNNWFARAALLLLFAAAFTIVPESIAGEWNVILAEIGIGFAFLMLIIGTLVAVFKLK